MNLRERRRADTMRQVQQVALDLFERHGYDAVSVAQVAAEAQVAERTVYRHFGTKEMLVVHDDLDAAFIEDAVRRAGAVGAVAGDGTTTHGWLRKMRVLRATPSLHGVFERATSELGDALGTAESDADGSSPFAARVHGRAVASVLAVAVDAWLEADGEPDLYDLVARGIDALTTA